VCGSLPLTPYSGGDTPISHQLFIKHCEVLEQRGKAMIHSSRHDRKTKAIAEVLAMIADAHPELAPHHPRPVRETDEWLWENATEFCAALDRYAGRARQRQSP
jgi:hypothetical protein